MRRSDALLATLLLAGLGPGLAGCGSKEPAAAPTDAAAADPVVEEDAGPAEEDASFSHVGFALPKTEAEKAAEKLASAPADTSNSPEAILRRDSLATDELLQLAKSAPNVSGPSPAAGADGGTAVASNNPASGMAMPGMIPGGPGGMASGYPMGGGSDGRMDPSRSMASGRGAGADGIPGMAPGMGGGSGSASSGSEKDDKFDTPIHGAEAFLDAVKAKDLRRLSRVVALRSGTESDIKHRPMFQAVLEVRLDDQTMEDLVEAFKDMKVQGTNNAKSSGMLGVIVGRKEGNDQITRTLYVRHEKAGWKVQDFSARHKLEGYASYGGNRGNAGGGSASSGGGSGSSSSSGGGGSSSQP